MNEKKQESSVWLILVVVAVVVVAGIFLIRKPSDTDPAKTKDGKDKIVLQLKWVKQSQFAGFLIAEAKGYYADENIEIEIKPGGVGINPVDVLIAGDADVAVAWTANTLPAVTKGEDIVNIGQGMQRTGLRLMAKKTSGIQTPADIAGKKIGTWPGGNEIEPYAFIGKQGLDKDRDVTLVSQGFDMNQLLNDEIDLASAMIYNEYWLPMQAGYTEDDFIVFDLEDEGVGMLQDALFVKADFLAENKDLLVRFLRASMKGWDWAIQNQEEAVDLLGIDFAENDVTARDHQIMSISQVAKLYAGDDAKDKGLFYINPDKMKQTVEISEKYVDEISDINLGQIYTDEIWKEAVEGVEFADYSNI